MGYKKSFGILCSLAALGAVSLQAEVTVAPVANVTLLGGQYWVSRSAPDSLGGNADIFVSPVINFSPRTALLPIYTGFYSRTKDVRELVGGGTLTREVQDHSFSLKLVHKVSNEWKLKARGGYKTEYLKETVDETWGKGLFDFQKMIVGLEGERTKGPWNSRLGADYYTMHYPNYTSLASESSFQTSLDTTTYAEISSQSGKDVLDYTTLAVFGEVARQFSPRASGFVHYDLSLKNFKDQRVVQRTGLFSSTLRQDMVHYLSCGLSLGTPRATIALSDTAQYYDSNQNSFDAGNSQFTPDSYDFMQNGLMPSVTFSLGSGERPVRLSLFWNLEYRAYLQRLAQYPDGTYKGDRISQIFNTTGFDVTCPLSGSLSLKLSSNYRDSSSNMRYEKNYQYNYYTFNYFCGINWQL